MGLTLESLKHLKGIVDTLRMFVLSLGDWYMLNGPG